MYPEVYILAATAGLGRGRGLSDSHTHLFHSSVYDDAVKRVNVHLDEELDAALAREARRTGVSKAALIRHAARALLDEQVGESAEDPWAAVTATITAPLPDTAADDDVIYR